MNGSKALLGNSPTAKAVHGRPNGVGAAATAQYDLLAGTQGLYTCSRRWSSNTLINHELVGFTPLSPQLHQKVRKCGGGFRAAKIPRYRSRLAARGWPNPAMTERGVRVGRGYVVSVVFARRLSRGSADRVGTKVIRPADEHGRRLMSAAFAPRDPL